jgi:hypothetical protein
MKPTILFSIAGLSLLTVVATPAQFNEQGVPTPENNGAPHHTTRRPGVWVRTPAKHSKAPTMASSRAAPPSKTPSMSCSGIGALEVRPGQSKTLARMRRLFPDFINGQIWKTSEKRAPVGGIETADNCSEVARVWSWNRLYEHIVLAQPLRRAIRKPEFVE